MSEKSPLFISAMELLGHSVELLDAGDGKKNKFIILHLSNAVELLLKDMVVDKGQSIYEDNNKNTINVWKAFKILDINEVVILQRPYIEMLIDDRNIIQHKFGYPSRESVVYYLDFVIALFQSCMHDHYAIEFDDIAEEYFTQNGLQLIGLGKKDPFSKVDAIAKYDLLSAVSTAYSILEEKVYELLGHEPSSRPVMIWHDRRFYGLLKKIDTSIIDSENPKKYFDEIRQARNVSVHRQHHDPDENQLLMKASLEKIKKLHRAIGEVPDDLVESVRKQG